ncbi:hypothetical protein D3C77_749400 [compost metagenome]
MHIFNALGFTTGRRRAAHTSTKRDTHAGNLALERPQHQLFVAVEVKACPIQVFNLTVEKGRKLRGIGNEVALIGKQSFQLCSQ